MAIIVPRRIPHLHKPEGLVEVDSSRAPSAFWLVHEGAGTPRDLITSTASVFNGSPEWSVTTQGRVLDFDGVNDDVNTTLTDSKFSVPNSSSNITVCFRIFPRHLGGSAGSFNDARAIIAKTDAAGAAAERYEWAIGIEGGTIYVRTSGGNSGALGTLTLNQWHDVVVTYEGGVGHTVYINKAKFFGANTDTSPHNSSWNIVFGRTVYGNRYDGLLHDVRIYDRLLTDAEAERYTDHPYEILKPRRRWVPVVIQGGAGATFDAAVTGTGTVAADLSTAITLASSLSATSSTQADLATQITLDSAVSANGAVAADLETAVWLAASVNASGNVTAELAGTGALFVASVAATGTVSADLDTSIPLGADVSASGTISSDLTTQITFATTVSGSITSFADLDTQITFAGSLTASGSTTAQLAGTGALFAASATGAITVSGDLLTQILMQSGLSASGVVSASLTVGAVVINTGAKETLVLTAENPTLTLS